MCDVCDGTQEMVLGVDAGGTYTKIGMKGRGRKDLTFHEKIPTPKSENFVRDIPKIVGEFLSDKPRPIVAGFSVPADVDLTRKMINTSIRFGCNNIPFSQFMPASHQDIPTYGINDGQAAGLGELVYGRGRDFRNFMFIALGTNVGGAIVFDGRLMTHSEKAVGRVAHLCINMDGPMCRCGQRGCWEMYVSTKAIINLAMIKMEREDSLLKDASNSIVPRDIACAADKGDRVAIEVFKEIAKYLAIGIANVANIVSVDAVFIGGGISLAKTHLHDPLRQELTPRFRYKDVKVLTSELYDNASLYGAIALAEMEGKV